MSLLRLDTLYSILSTLFSLVSASNSRSLHETVARLRQCAVWYTTLFYEEGIELLCLYKYQ